MSAELLVATRKGLFTWEKTSTGWDLVDTAFVGDPVTAALRDRRDNMLYAALNLGHFGVKLRQSADGMAWNEIAVPQYPKQPDAAQGPAWSLAQIWSLDEGGDDRPGRLWAGTIPGGLFRSEDAGASWQLVRSLWDRPERQAWFGGGYDAPGIHSVCVDPTDSKKVTVAISCGGVWRSADGGDSWTLRADGMRAAYVPPERSRDPNIQDPHRMVCCPAKPDHFWVQHHNGIFRSLDDAQTWDEIVDVAPSTFGFAVAVHPKDPAVAWFIPALKDECRVPVGGTLVVNRTRDGGKSFQTLRNGLPQRHAYDLVYRHALDVDSSGDLVAFGSTTGGLWISEDQGEQWACLSSHLPPVYCVRFSQAS